MTRTRQLALGLVIFAGLLTPIPKAAAWFVARPGWGGVGDGDLTARRAAWGGWGGGWRGGCWRCGVAPGAVVGLGYNSPYDQGDMGAPQMQGPMGAPSYQQGSGAQPMTSSPPAPPGSSPYPAGAPATAMPAQPPPPTASSPGAPATAPPSGAHLAALPGGSRSMIVNNVQYYQNGATWYRPYFGPSGVYYEAVPAP